MPGGGGRVVGGDTPDLLGHQTEWVKCRVPRCCECQISSKQFSIIVSQILHKTRLHSGK